MSGAYYNEHDPKAAAWLRELITRNLIAPGDVDERSILDVRPDDLADYTQCHFFAGIGVWSYAMRQAGWPDDRPVWTGSCPCQPFSAAGRRAGLADERHLWPAWFWLIGQRKPVAVFGEQVASRDGYDWLDAVRDDLEGAAYAIGALDLCAAGFGAPHIRQRLYFVADAADCGREDEPARAGGDGERVEPGEPRAESGALRPAPFGLANAEHDGGRADEPGRGAEGRTADGRTGSAAPGRPGPTNGFWRDADWLRCRDGRWRPVKRSLAPLVAGASRKLGPGSDRGAPEDEISEEEADATGEARMMRLRGYGNAICSEVAANFIRAYMKVSMEQEGQDA